MAPRQPHVLQCMEIWGGNARANRTISMPGMDVWVYSEPFNGEPRGGDIYYLSSCGAGRILRFVVADVAGHGGVVSEVSTRLRRLMSAHVNKLDQTRFARALNRELLRLDAAGPFATALLATYFAPTNDLAVCMAGHPGPVWFHAGRGTWEQLTQPPPATTGRSINLPLGVMQPTDYRQFAVPLAKGDLVLLYSDGIHEARNPEGRRLGQEGLLRILSEIDPRDVPGFLPAVLRAISHHRGDRPPEDDQTLILLHPTGETPPRRTLGEKMLSMARMLRLAPWPKDSGNLAS